MDNCSIVEKVLGRIAIGLAAVAALSFGASSLLLNGEDPTGWWNFVPAYVFYFTVFVLIPALGVVALVTFARSPSRKHR